MNDQTTQDATNGFSGAQVALIVLLTIALTAGASYWVYRTYINPSAFTPVALSGNEQTLLDRKLRQLGVEPRDLLPHAARDQPLDEQGRLQPEQYQENPDNRDIRMSERELNATLASNPQLASRDQL